MEIAVVIMAGGAGTRFWPLSTESRPKQFLKLLGERSLLQESYERARLLAAPERILVLTSEAFVPLVREQLPDLPPGNVVGEPRRRDTAAAVALGALLLRRRWGNPVMAILTADHRIEPLEAFRAAMLSAAAAAAGEPVLYTFGIPPTYPATGYGYLQVGEKVQADAEAGGGRRAPQTGDGQTAAQPEHRELRCFREKPDTQTAREFVGSGEFLWNSGMFVWQVEAILAELRRHLPGHLSALEAAVEREGTGEFPVLLEDAFAVLAPVSIDFGVMERAARVRVVVAPFGWSDLGGWLALEEFLAEDGRGNRYRGQVTTLNATGNLVFNDDPEELVALVGVRDLVVVRAGSRTLVVDRSHCEDVKELVRALEREGQGRHM